MNHALPSTDLIALASDVLEACRLKGMKIATAESCTGGLIAGYLTEVAGSSDVVDRGFVTYSNEAKEEMLGVPMAVINSAGAVSEEVALLMAAGALSNSEAEIAVAVTGVAGPGGGTADKPVGLVHIAAAGAGHPVHLKCTFGDIDRGEIRTKTVEQALKLIQDRVKA